MEGIVLRLVNYGESDQIVGLLTASHGKISAFASGARVSRKRFGGALDLFSRLDADIRPPKDTHGSLWRLNRVDLLDAHLELRSDLKRLAQASYLAECLWNLLGESDPSPVLYEWWKEVLKRISLEPVSIASDLRLELEMLSLCGFAPHWDECLECAARPEEGKVFFSFERGGILCERCRKTGEGRWIDASWVAMVQDGRELSRETAAQLRGVLNSFVSHTLGREPRSQRFREEVLGG
jgi:DNA repair protein RecO (recombination protein O)